LSPFDLPIAGDWDGDGDDDPDGWPPSPQSATIAAIEVQLLAI